MSIEQLMPSVRDMLTEVPYLYGTPVIVEDLGDIANGIETYFGKSTRCVVVMFAGSEPVKQGAGLLLDSVKIAVRCYDKPSLTRVDNPGLTLLGMAQEIARALQGKKSPGMASCLFYRGISQITQHNKGVVSCDVFFDTKETI